jgi:hypothetical protein
MKMTVTGYGDIVVGVEKWFALGIIKPRATSAFDVKRLAVKVV